MQILDVSNEDLLVKCCMRTQEVMKAIPRLEKLINSICDIVFPVGN